MELRVLVLPGGRLEIAADGEISFEQAEAVTAAVLAQLGAALPGLAQKGEVERHRTGGPDHAHIVPHTTVTHTHPGAGGH